MATSSTTPRGLRILISGSSGMVGNALIKKLSIPSPLNNFHPQIYRLVRTPSPKQPDEIYWDPYEMRIDINKCEGMDVVIHLAGENIGSGDGGMLSFTGRWNERKKHLIMESRRRGTTLLAKTLSVLKQKPTVFISASGIGYYGNGGGTALTEASPKGTGFLADVADVWESTTNIAKDNGIRVVNLRFGVILSKDGGVIQKLYWPFYFGGGGPIGSGQQYMSWIALEDAIRAIQFSITKSSLQGPVNTCSPNPVRNSEFVQTLGNVLHRPALIPMPETIVRTVFGEMGEETLLVSQKGLPTKLTEAGFQFSYPHLKEAIEKALSD